MPACRTATAALCLSAAPLSAFADTPAPVMPEPAPVVAAPMADPGPEFAFTLRGGVAAKPSYFGSDDVEFGPDLGFSFGYLRAFGREFGSLDPDLEPLGPHLRGSFRYIPERDSSEFDEISGLDDVDAAVELGLGIGYRARNYEAFADLRYGAIGHESLVAEVGADALFRPTDRLTVSAGPRLFMGSDDYADTYYGVSAGESAASGLEAYDAGGGLLRAGVELGATYRIDDNWGVEGAIRYDQFLNDAEDSPIVRQGDDSQLKVRIGVTRRITLDF